MAEGNGNIRRRRVEGTKASGDDKDKKVVTGVNGDDKRVKGSTRAPEFAARESPLTTLLATSPHIRAIYHIFVVILLMLLLDTAVYDILEHGKLSVGVGTVARGFGGLGRGLWMWLQLVAITVSFYPALLVYDAGARWLAKFPVLLGAWRLLGALGLVALQAALIVRPTLELYKRPLALATSVSFTCEMFRLAMKLHASAVALVPRCGIHKSTSAGKSTSNGVIHGPGRGGQTPAPLPTFKHYMYYLFAPTLIYRDQYPRTSRTRWDLVAFHLLEVAAIIFYNSFLWERFILPNWSHYGKEPEVEAGQVVRGIFSCVLPGVLSFLCGFYCLLHAWLNAAAEVMTFGDRLFYEEWWTVSQFSRYYRAWNRVVHSWLREHIHLPLGQGPAATLAVFVISALAHEVILALSFGFWYPVLLLQFGAIGLLLVPLTAPFARANPHAANLFMWWGFFMGNGLLWSLYPMEYFARQNCPPSPDDSFFVPKSWSCPRIVLKPNWTFKIPLTVNHT